MSEQREINLGVGKQSQRGRITLSSWLPKLLTLSVSYGGERAASVTLTREQVRQLQQALEEIEPSIESQADDVRRQGEGLKLAA